MLEDGQPEGREGQRSGVDVRHDESSLVFWVIVLKVLDDVPQKEWLKHLNSFLHDRMTRSGMSRFPQELRLLRNIHVKTPMDLPVKTRRGR